MITTDEVRRFALSLPETKEKKHWGKASFRVRNKIFAIIQEDGQSVVVKTTPDDRMAYTMMDPTIFSVPDNFSHLNYMVININRIEPNELHGLLFLGWRLVAPKMLVTAYEAKLGEK